MDDKVGNMNPEDTFRGFAQYYDSYVRGFSEDLQVYGSFCSKNDSILEVGCGTGRVLEYLLKRGHTATGVDISEEMLDISRGKLSLFIENGALKLVKHNLIDRPLSQQFTKVLVTFYALNYVIDRPEAFLKNTYLSMKDGGRIVADLFYPRTLAHPDLEGIWTSHTLLHQNRQIGYRDKRTLHANIEERIQIFVENGKEIRIKTLRRYYSKSTIKKMFENCGFKVVRISDTYHINGFAYTKEDVGTPNGNSLVVAAKC